MICLQPPTDKDLQRVGGIRLPQSRILSGWLAGEPENSPMFRQDMQCCGFGTVRIKHGILEEVPCCAGQESSGCEV